MYHTITFTADFTLDLEISPKHLMEQVRIEKGVRLRAQLKPYVTETADGLVEVADLFFEDGSATRMVPFACFSFAN